VLAEHEAAWASRWRCSDVEVEGDAAAQQALRFAIYHLNSAANPADERVSIGARALTGDDYHGHVFWDTEIFLLPFYILTWPEAARALLMYRFRKLGFWKALEQVFPSTRHQRCWVHKTANVLNKVALSVQANMKVDLREMRADPPSGRGSDRCVRRQIQRQARQGGRFSDQGPGSAARLF
jgi:hypothetical protein